MASSENKEIWSDFDLVPGDKIKHKESERTAVVATISKEDVPERYAPLYFDDSPPGILPVCVPLVKIERIRRTDEVK